jgi:hypothetical protein
LALSIAVALAGPADAEDADPGLNDPDDATSESDDSGDDESERNASENGSGNLGDKAFDLIVMRPLGVGRIPFGFACFLPAAIFAELPPAMGGDSKRWRAAVDDAWQLFVMDAVESTFMTPLGEFEEEY